MRKMYLSILLASLFLCGSMITIIQDTSEAENRIEFKLESQFKLEEPKVKLNISNQEIKQIKLAKEIEIERQRKSDEEIRLANERQRAMDEQKKIEQLGKRVKFHITYYCNLDNSLQGGLNDKKGIPLTNYNYPVIALPSDVKYGSKATFDESINGSNEYTNVDTGGAIVWLNDEHTECKADVFIANVSESWIMRNTENRIVYGYIK